jgi:hypothetical protein
LALEESVAKALGAVPEVTSKDGAPPGMGIAPFDKIGPKWDQVAKIRPVLED